MGAPKTLIMIPAYNEEQALPAVLGNLKRAVPDCDVLVIDDGSTDRTARVAADGGAIVASLPFNLGVGGALRTGFRYALRYGYVQAVQLDGDGQHEAEEIPTLLAAIDDGANLVIGSRFAAEADRYQVGRTRGRAMALLRVLVRLLSGQRFTDTSSGFRAFDHAAIDLFSRSYPVEYLGDTVEALLLAVYAGLDVREVPTTMRTRAGGVPSSRNLRLVWHYLRLLLMIALTASPRRRPREMPR
jgi:glycosyltransferase involved in cell wall biosynthesis